MSGRQPTRADDEAALAMLMDRHNGVSSYQIAARLGLTPGKVRTVTNRIRDEDVASGDDIEGAYW